MKPPAALALAAVLALAAGTANAVDDHAGAPQPDCPVPDALMAIGSPLAHAAARIEHDDKLTIVAIGSSSTKGFGASAPDLSYPSRLAAELQKKFPHLAILVLNRGKGGEEVPQMLARIQRDVAAAHPDLVIWQLGTNAVLRHDDMAAERGPIERGLAALKATGADIILMDVQYAPRVLARPGYAAMEAIIADAAKRAHVGLFRRFAIMQRWWASRGNGLPAMIGPDGLHMNDAGYGCLAASLAEALAANWQVQGVGNEEPGSGEPGMAAAAPRRHTAARTGALLP
jgi:lysophospholipase L1-like esterase